MKDRVKAAAGSLGGLKRIHLYGNPGTPEGRRLGGLRALKTHAYRGTGFKLLRPLRRPKRNATLAELMGILAGDGHLGTYQVSVTTNSITDIEHANHIQKLFLTIFGIKPSITKRLNKNAVVVLLSSKAACDFLESQGMVRGNKVKEQLAPPTWVLKRPLFQKMFLRGLIDTDGTVYCDKHRIKGRDYASVCIAFTNASLPLLDFVETTLTDVGYHPTRWGRNIRLRRRKDVLGYAKTIGFSNPKHARKIKV